MKVFRMKLLSTLFFVAAVESFVTTAFHRPNGAASPTKSRLFAEKESLKFRVDSNVTSNPLDTENKDELCAFFKCASGRNHFLSGGGTSKVSEESLTPEIEQLWKDACTEHYGTEFLPEKGDAVVASETCVQFPGLKMVNWVYSGVKLDESGDFPFYHFLLIAERKRVYGAPPVVWAFNKLTGSSGKEDKICPPMGMAISKNSIMEKDGRYCINFDCRVVITVEFPKLLMKIIPVSKEKAEEQGSASVRKAVEKDITTAIASANDAFLSWKEAVSFSAV